METFKVHILGCGSALPTLHHNSSAQVVEFGNKMFMIDCGEGAQVQLRRFRLGFSRINHVFISHLHGDHCFGLIGMISTFGMLGRTAPLHIYAPAELEPVLDMEMQLYCHGLEYKVVFHATDTTKSVVIYEDRTIEVITVPLQHRVPCCGFIFREKPSLPHIRRDMIDFYNIPVCYIANIKNGDGWTTEDGTHIPHSRLTYPADPQRSYAYCSDTRYIHSLYKLIDGVNVLYHESTYDKTKVDRAKLYWHSTSGQAAKVASKGHVGKLVLGHFSARYEDEQIILDEAIEIFPNTILANEGMVIDVK